MTCGSLVSVLVCTLCVSDVWGLLDKSLKHNYYIKKMKFDEDHDMDEKDYIIFINNCDYIHISILF